MATDAEVAIYLYTVTMALAVDESWVQIYMYTMTRLMGDKFPEDMRLTKLTQCQEGAACSGG